MLNARQEKFAQGVVDTGGNLVVAFKRSGWAWEKYRTDKLSLLAYEKFTNPKIAQRIKELQGVDAADDTQGMFDCLQPLQQKVVVGIIAGLSDIDAYYAGGGKSKNRESAAAVVSRMLTDAKVRAYLDLMKRAAVKSAVMGREEMLERLSNLSRTNMDDLLEWHVPRNEEGEPDRQSFWMIKESARQDPNAMASIAEVTAGKDGIKVKQHSPLAAMKQLADLGGYNKPQKIEQSGTVTSVQMSKEDYAEVRKQMLADDDC